MYDEPKLIHAGQAIDDRGTLLFCNDFDLAGVVRFYCITNHRRGFVRAWHGHQTAGTFLWPISGTWKLAAAEMQAYPDRGCRQTHVIDRTSILHVPGGWYHGHQNLTDDAILGVFSTATIAQVREDDHRLPWDQWPDTWIEVQR